MPALETPSLDPAERRAITRFVGLLRHRFSDNLEGVLLYGLHADEEPRRAGSKLRLLVLLVESSRTERVAVLELLWQAAVAERATEHYFSIRVADRAAAVRSRAIDEFRAPKVEPDGIVLFARPGGPRFAPIANSAQAKKPASLDVGPGRRPLDRVRTGPESRSVALSPPGQGALPTPAPGPRRAHREPITRQAVR